MAVQQTTHLHLNKPDIQEFADVTVINGNMDTIDTAVYNLQNAGSANSGKYMKVGSDGAVAPASIPEVTTSAAGLMSSADKTKLNGIANNANNYSLPLAASGTRGGVQVGYSQNGKNYPVQLASEKAYVNVPWTDTVYSLPTAANGTKGGVQIGYSQNGKNYPVQLSGEKAFVNVPWTDTTYNDATSGAHGLMSAADKTKLNGITAGAQPNPGVATTTANGLMSSSDKVKLNSVTAGAQPNPGNATTSASGLMSSSDKAKLNTVSYNANHIQTVTKKKSYTINANSNVYVSDYYSAPTGYKVIGVVAFASGSVKVAPTDFVFSTTGWGMDLVNTSNTGISAEASITLLLINS